MEGYTLQRLLSTLGATAPELDMALLRAADWRISIDSRTVRKGDVFFAIKGDRFNGADYVDDAYAAGAVFSVVNAEEQKTRSFTSPVVSVSDTVKALGAAAKEYRSFFEGDVVAVTGTSGKTTAREMMLAVLKRKWSVHGTKGNFNNQIGLPLSIFGLEKYHQCAVFELGMSAPGEIAYLADITNPDMGVILNVGAGHAEFFKSVEDIAESKLELVPRVNPNGTILINGDDKMLRPALRRSNAKVIFFGCGKDCLYRAESITMQPDGCVMFTVMDQLVQLNVPGMHNVYNALAAFAVGHMKGMDSGEIAKALEDFQAPEQRMQTFKIRNVKIINDSYNANPLSMKAAADVLKIMHGRKKVAVLGDMNELGAMTEYSHISIGRIFAESGISTLCLVGAYADLYEFGAREGGLSASDIQKYPDAESAIPFVKSIIDETDIMLVKGSRSVGMERIIAAVSEGN